MWLAARTFSRRRFNLSLFKRNMRNRFECAFPIGQEERKIQNNVQSVRLNGMYVSSNGYYGYQAVPQNRQNKTEESTEHMDVQVYDSGIQFNNYIATEDRLSDFQRSYTTRGFDNRKRRYEDDDIPILDFKKRRENDPIPELPSTNRYVKSRQPTHNVPDMPRHLMGHFI